jgi:hypothetical protein
MSLDLAKLQKVRQRGGKTIAQCPACNETGGDTGGEHLVIDAHGRFACVVHPGKSGREHRSKIFRWVGKRPSGSIAIFPTFSNENPQKPLKTGVLGRLGRGKNPYAYKEKINNGNIYKDNKHPVLDVLTDDIKKGVLPVLEQTPREPSEPPASVRTVVNVHVMPPGALCRICWNKRGRFMPL